MSESMLTMDNPQVLPDFEDTAIAFAHLSDRELAAANRLFLLMSKPWLVNVGNPLASLGVRWNIPFARWAVRHTIFRQFVGGQSLLGCQPTIDKLAQFNTLTILDYGVEGREAEDDFNATLRENLRAIEFASKNAHVPVVSTKLSGLASNRLLEKMQRGDSLSASEEEAWRAVVKRLEGICMSAADKGVSVFIDAEESWIQDPIDELVVSMMRRFNKHRVIVYNTYQMYRTDRLRIIREHASLAEAEGWMLGAKIVRGAYMEKERLRAKEMGYPSPIQPDKRTTDEAYNKALRFLVENYRTIGSCNATHNMESCRLMAQWIDELKIERNHPRLNFSQLFGMSDHITFNLAAAGYNVAKYVPYGKVEEVIPYLLRRAEENTSVAGELSRELSLLHRELKRRKETK
jgi:proline dehydrogenase